MTELDKQLIKKFTRTVSKEDFQNVLKFVALDARLYINELYRGHKKWSRHSTAKPKAPTTTKNEMEEEWRKYLPEEYRKLIQKMTEKKAPDHMTSEDLDLALIKAKQLAWAKVLPQIQIENKARKKKQEAPGITEHNSFSFYKSFWNIYGSLKLNPEEVKSLSFMLNHGVVSEDRIPIPPRYLLMIVSGVLLRRTRKNGKPNTYSEYALQIIACYYYYLLFRKYFPHGITSFSEGSSEIFYSVESIIHDGMDAFRQPLTTFDSDSYRKLLGNLKSALNAKVKILSREYYGSSEFQQADFTGQKQKRELCEAILSDFHDLPLNKIPYTIPWLNEIIALPDFYSRAERMNVDDFPFLPEIEQLITETETYRNENFSDLEYEVKNKITKLNRLLLRQLYPLLAPLPETNKSVEVEDDRTEESSHREGISDHDILTQLINETSSRDNIRQSIRHIKDRAALCQEANTLFKIAKKDTTALQKKMMDLRNAKKLVDLIELVIKTPPRHAVEVEQDTCQKIDIVIKDFILSRNKKNLYKDVADDFIRPLLGVRKISPQTRAMFLYTFGFFLNHIIQGIINPTAEQGSPMPSRSS